VFARNERSPKGIIKKGEDGKDGWRGPFPYRNDIHAIPIHGGLEKNKCMGCALFLKNNSFPPSETSPSRKIFSSSLVSIAEGTIRPHSRDEDIRLILRINLRNKRIPSEIHFAFARLKNIVFILEAGEGSFRS
jgi:hypothetical protein